MGEAQVLTVHARDSHGNATLWDKGHVNQLQVSGPLSGLKLGAAN
jgi:hypothetical protein